MKKYLIIVGVLLVGGVFFAMCPCGKDHTAVAHAAEAKTETPAQQAEVKVTADSYIVYYFHGARRCYTCNKIETDAKAVINEAYKKEIADKKLAIITLNVEEKENAHFVKDFGLVSSSVVLAKIDDKGKIEKFKVLPKTWTLVRDDAKFKDYILTESKAFME